MGIYLKWYLKKKNVWQGEQTRRNYLKNAQNVPGGGSCITSLRRQVEEDLKQAQKTIVQADVKRTTPRQTLIHPPSISADMHNVTVNSIECRV